MVDAAWRAVPGDDGSGNAAAVTTTIAATVTATAASPVTLVVVRIMSMIRSTPATKAIVSSGTSTAPNTSAIMISPAPGMPAAPTAPSVPSSAIMP